MLNFTATADNSILRTCRIDPTQVENFTEMQFGQLSSEYDKSCAAQLVAVVVDVAECVFVYDGWKFNEYYNFGTNQISPLSRKQIEEVRYFYRISKTDRYCDATELLKQFDFDQLQNAFEWDQKAQEAVGIHLLKTNNPEGFAWLWAATRTNRIVSDIFDVLFNCAKPGLLVQNQIKLLKEGDVPKKFRFTLSGEGYLRANLNLDWLRESAKVDKLSKFALGLCLYSGFFVEKNYAESARLFDEVKDKFKPAMGYLGECYEFGFGVEKDLGKAIELYEQGLKHEFDVPSRLALAELRYDGEYLKISLKQALEYVDEALSGLTEFDPDYERAVNLRENIKELIHPHSDSDDSDSDRHLDKRQRTPESDAEFSSDVSDQSDVDSDMSDHNDTVADDKAECSDSDVRYCC